MTIRLGQLSDKDAILAFATRALESSDRVGAIDPEVLGNTISAALTLPQYGVWVSGDGPEIKGLICGIITPSFYGRCLSATDILFYAEDGSGYRLYKQFLKWAESFDLVNQVYFTNSFKIDGDDRQLDNMMKRMKFSSTGKHYVKAIDRSVSEVAA